MAVVLIVVLTSIILCFLLQESESEGDEDEMKTLEELEMEREYNLAHNIVPSNPQIPVGTIPVLETNAFVKEMVGQMSQRYVHDWIVKHADALRQLKPESTKEEVDVALRTPDQVLIKVKRNGGRAACGCAHKWSKCHGDVPVDMNATLGNFIARVMLEEIMRLGRAYTSTNRYMCMNEDDLGFISMFFNGMVVPTQGWAKKLRKRR